MKVINLDGYDIEFPDNATRRDYYNGKYPFIAVGNLEFYIGRYTLFAYPHTKSYTLKCRPYVKSLDVWDSITSCDGEVFELCGESRDMLYLECVENFAEKVRAEISTLQAAQIELENLLKTTVGE